MLHGDDLVALAAESNADGRAWQEQVEELGVHAEFVERAGALLAQQYGGLSVSFHDAVEGAFASGFHLGLLAGKAPTRSKGAA